MDIGIVTVFDSPNFGSFLQAYAMMNYLQKMGHHAGFIKWNKKNPIISDILKKAVITKKVSAKGIRNAINKVGYYKRDMLYLPIADKIEGFDLILIGSDTLWDVKRPFFSIPLFYGKYDFDIPCISYAVSCSDSQKCDFEKKRALVENIKKINAIMVRDKHTQMLIKEFFDLEAQVVCDPTILLENKFWNDKIDVDLNSAVLVYTYSLPKSIISHIKKYAQVQGLKLVSIGLYQSWCDEHINCSALDFPAYLQSARLVITNTFHGTIFSILTKSNVVSVEKGNKLKELIESLNAQQIVLEKECTYENFSDMANQSIDYSDIYAHMEEIRTRSSRLLRNIIGSYCSGNNGEES